MWAMNGLPATRSNAGVVPDPFPLAFWVKDLACEIILLYKVSSCRLDYQIVYFISHESLRLAIHYFTEWNRPVPCPISQNRSELSLHVQCSLMHALGIVGSRRWLYGRQHRVWVPETRRSLLHKS